MIKTKSILFTLESILSITGKRKTQTRRVIKHQPVIDPESGFVFSGDYKHLFKNDCTHRPWRVPFIGEICPYQLGDILCIKETYYQYGLWIKAMKGWLFIPAEEKVYYSDQVDLAALGNDPGIRGTKHGLYRRSAMFMPKKYTRYWIKITDIKIEQVQDISQEDAKAEGAGTAPHRPAGEGVNCRPHADGSLRRDCYVCEFKNTWNGIHGPKFNSTQWDANPWVWVYSFKRTDKP